MAQQPALAEFEQCLRHVNNMHLVILQGMLSFESASFALER